MERKKRGKEVERERESMRIGKEKKRAKRDRNSNIFGVLRKYLIWEEMGKKRGVGEEDSRSHEGLIRSRIPVIFQ